MIDQIISALKISLNECKKFENPAEYIYELNMVLSRYKTNLFNMLEDKHKYLHDPREFFQFRISTSWRTKPGFSRVTTLKDNSPIMLQVNGFQPFAGERKNKEKIYNKAVRIDDVIDLERIMSLKSDHYYCGLMQSPGYVSEEDVILTQLGAEKYAEMSMYLNLDKTVDDVIVFSLQLNSVVPDSVMAKHNEASAAAIADNPMTAKKLRTLQALAKVHEGMEEHRIPKDVKMYMDGKIPNLDSDKESIPTNVVDSIFGGTKQEAGSISASAVKKTAPFRAKNHLRLANLNGGVGASRKKNKFW
ncbi:hypothetical protein OBP_256 [Pseudomonas phage OBP]|uniref:hypothetical protein n=1 Tax=Pseudomonas phage OBP TaxID=1124849 RepID=UPI000240D5E9|nr:hypothetical protein OBP_256 [Pseudomonas phage OBP]AEV89693.1 hypothetical protein OBP_256 [Pseudomonas phage OBP]